MRVHPFVGLIFAATASVSAQSAVPKWSATIDLTIGAGDQPIGPFLFEEVSGLAFDAQGRILVVERKANEVRVFGAKGEHLFTFGRPGAGPADLKTPCCIALSPDGKMVIQEDGNNRYSVFTLSPTKATFQYAIRMPPTTDHFGLFNRVRWDTAKLLVNISGAHFPDHPFSGIVRSFLDTDGAVHRVDSIPPAPKDSIGYFTVVKTFPGGGTGSTTYTQQYGAAALQTVGPNGEYALAVSNNYAVSWFDASHKRVALIVRSGEGPLLSATERDATVKRDKGISEAIGKPLPFATPKRKPILSEIGFDLDGRLWIQRATAEDTNHEADVFDRTGKQIATVTWPANVRFTTWAIHANTGLGVSTDEDGVSRVVRVQFKSLAK